MNVSLSCKSAGEREQPALQVSIGACPSERRQIKRRRAFNASLAWLLLLLLHDRIVRQLRRCCDAAARVGASSICWLGSETPSNLPVRAVRPANCVFGR